MRTGEPVRRLTLSHRRSFVQRHTRLRDLEGLPGIRLHVADEVEPVWHATEEIAGMEDEPIPFWAFAWAGGLALARHLQAHPEVVAGKRVLDLATGSGLVAIAAARAGAAAVEAADIDPFAEAAVALNARANGVQVRYLGRDLLAGPPPRAIEVLLAADTWYEAPLAERLLPWLRASHEAGTLVLLADPGRRYLPRHGLRELARYEVSTTTTLEDRGVVPASVFALE